MRRIESVPRLARRGVVVLRPRLAEQVASAHGREQGGAETDERRAAYEHAPR